ncbi:hypothetical protein BH18VER1_BH18VER1_20790 [soil metagenome]
MKTKFCLALALGALLLAPNTALVAADAVSREDKEFFKNAGEINMTEIALGRMAQERGFSPEIKALGAKLQADHAKMTEELAALAQQKGVTMDIEPAATEKKMLSSFQAKSGAEFDREFREHMSKDHAKAMHTFEDAAKDSKDADVKAYATKSLPMLKAHYEAVGGKQ